MRTTIVISSVMITGLASPATGQGGGIAAVRWLASCWEMSAPNRRVVERWYEPSSGEMRGNSRTIAGAREIEGERLRIYEKGDTLVYDAHPSGQARTEFRGRPTVAGEIAFENPQHDFPQRISYRKVGSDSLLARIEGDRAGRRAPVNYAYRRVGCSGFTDSPAEVAESALRVKYDDLVALLNASASGLNAWFAKYSRPDFTYVFWATAGYRPPVVTREQVDRIAQAGQSAASAALTDRTNSTNIERTLVRGDTAEVLVTLRIAFKFVDAAGRYGPTGERRARAGEQVRLDRWVRVGDRWSLANAALIAEDIFVDGRLVQKNGKSVEARSP
ncbi:MAG: DUF6265 family protein [Gemmatimonadaceae bacterium]